jgi:hypothetical protein
MGIMKMVDYKSGTHNMYKESVDGVYVYQFCSNLQADKSSVVAKGPFFPQVWTQGIESVEQMCDSRTYLLKMRTLRSSKGNLMHLI